MNPKTKSKIKNAVKAAGREGVSNISYFLLRVFLPVILTGLLYALAFVSERGGYAGAYTLSLAGDMVKTLLVSLVILLGGVLLLEGEIRKK